LSASTYRCTPSCSSLPRALLSFPTRRSSDLQQHDGDHVVDKTTPDSFLRTGLGGLLRQLQVSRVVVCGYATEFCVDTTVRQAARSEEHTSELQSRENIVCRLPLSKKKNNYQR